MIRVLVVDEAGQQYEALRPILEEADDIYLVGCARSLTELHYLLPHSNQILVTSPLADMAIDTLIATIRTAIESEAEAAVKIIVLDVADDPDLILHYIEMGVDGYVLAHEPPEHLINKARAAHQEKAIMSPSLAADMLERISELSNQAPTVATTAVVPDPLEALTPRELDVLDLIAKELTNREIAETLIIGTGTVKNHVHKILKKLEVSTRYEAAAIYQAHQDERLV